MLSSERLSLPKTMMADLSSTELTSVCKELEQQIHHYSLIEQGLIKTRDRLTSEISRYKSIQHVSEQAKKIHHFGQLAQFCVQAVIELFHAECAFLLEITHGSPLMVKIVAQHGLDSTPRLLPLGESWGRNRRTAFRVERGDPLLRLWEDLDLCQMMACPLSVDGNNTRNSMLLCAGRTHKYERLSDPFDPELVSTFEVLSRQIEGHFQNLHAHEVIQEQVDQLKALGQLKEQANRMKDEFLATLSHELRTPLNVIQGHVEILLHDRGGLSHEQIHHSLEAIERSANSQTRIISDLLDVSRIITGKLSFCLQLVNPLQAMTLALKSLSSFADSKGVEISVFHDPSLPTFIEVDPTRVQQIIWNLISNAIKFTPPGGKVFVESRQVGSNYTIKVKDTGLGIDPDFLPYAFDRFKQEDSSSTRQFGGLGLGLSIVKHLTELHGGQVTAHSEGKGRGSEFIVSIPIEAGKQIDHLSNSRISVSEITSAMSIRLDEIRVLVVDDSEDNRDLVTLILSKTGAIVDEAGSAKEARARLKQQIPDVIISDIGMPDEDGLTFIKKLRTDPHPLVAAVPAIALTAYARAEEVQRILDAGFQIHVSKPVTRHTLVENIYSLIQPRH